MDNRTKLIDTVKQALLREPARISAIDAAKTVLKNSKEKNFLGEEFHLTQLRAFLTLSKIFASVMPEVHAKYKNKSYFEQGHALFNHLGFPIFEDNLEDILEEGENPLLYPIPICGENPFSDVEYNDFTELRLFQQVADLLFRPEAPKGNQDLKASDREWRHLADKYKLAENLRPTGYVDLPLFEEVCKTLTSPLKYLGEIFRMYEFNTDSEFFNFNWNEYTPEYGWSRQDVAFLRKEYAKAEVLIDHLRKVDKYFGGKRAAAHLADACRLYHRVRKLTDEKTKAAAASEGKPLVGIL